MTDETNLGAARSYVAKNEKSLEAMGVEVVAFLQLAKGLDETTSAALSAEYRKYKTLLDAAVAATAVVEEGEDPLLSPEA
jgi:hypothetical protein